MYISIVGIIMLIVFMTLILTKRTSALTALVVVPIVFGFPAIYFATLLLRDFVRMKRT